MPAADPSFTIRTFQPGDLPGTVALLERALPGEPVSAERFTRQVLLDPNFDARGAVVACAKGRVAGVCIGIARQTPLENAPPDSDRGFITLMAVDPGLQRSGAGSALLRAVESFLASQNRKTVLVSPYAPGYFIPGVDVGAGAAALSFFASRGYTEAYRAVSMEASLWSLTAPSWVEGRMQVLDEEGVTIEAYHPELSLPLLRFVQEEFPGDWVRVAREAMMAILRGDPPERLFIARDGERILGFVHHEKERFGPIGVEGEERGRGIGQALMFKALRAMRHSGLRTAWFLWSDDRTARRLYDSASFREVRRFAILRKDLA